VFIVLGIHNFGQKWKRDIEKKDIYLLSRRVNTKKGQTLGGDWENSQKKTCLPHLEYFGLWSLKYIS